MQYLDHNYNNLSFLKTKKNTLNDEACPISSTNQSLKKSDSLRKTKKLYIYCMITCLLFSTV